MYTHTVLSGAYVILEFLSIEFTMCPMVDPVSSHRD
jgi:hypothetical protein